MRSFIGGLRAGDRGLYVSTGGFTKEARYEADRANVPIRLLDLDGFVRHYVVVPEKLRTLDHGRPWRDDHFASTRVSSSRDMSR